MGTDGAYYEPVAAMFHAAPLSGYSRVFNSSRKCENQINKSSIISIFMNAYDIPASGVALCRLSNYQHQDKEW